MAEETAFENGRICNFEGLVNLTLDRVILHTVVHHSSTSTCHISLKSKKLFVDGRTDIRDRLFWVNSVEESAKKYDYVGLLLNTAENW